MDETVPRILQFDRFELDLTRGCLRLDGRELELRPKPFKVLCHLAERAGRLSRRRTFRRPSGTTSLYRTIRSCSASVSCATHFPTTSTA